MTLIKYPGELSGSEFLAFVMDEIGMDVKELSKFSGIGEATIRRMITGQLKLLPTHTEEIFKVLKLRVVVLQEVEEDDDDDLGFAEEGDWAG